MESKKLFRSEKDKLLAGVCSGLAIYFNIDVNIVRVLFIAGVLFGAGSFVLVYIILWVILPVESQLANKSDDTIKNNVEEIKEKVNDLFDGKKKPE